MRFTFPALITSAIKLCRCHKNADVEARPGFTTFTLFWSYFVSVGERLANQSHDDSEIHPAAHIDTSNTGGGTRNCSPPIPSSGPDFGRVWFWRLDIWLLCTSLHYLWGQYFRVACSAASYHAHYWYLVRRQGFRHRQLWYSHYQGGSPWCKTLEEVSSSYRSWISKSFVVARNNICRDWCQISRKGEGETHQAAIQGGRGGYQNCSYFHSFVVLFWWTTHSTHTRTVNVSWNASRNPFG